VVAELVDHEVARDVRVRGRGAVEVEDPAAAVDSRAIPKATEAYRSVDVGGPNSVLLGRSRVMRSRALTRSADVSGILARICRSGFDVACFKA